jgi:hypothetical protein
MKNGLQTIAKGCEQIWPPPDKPHAQRHPRINDANLPAGRPGQRRLANQQPGKRRKNRAGRTRA